MEGRRREEEERMMVGTRARAVRYAGVTLD